MGGIVIIGLNGSGKTTVGRLVAERLGLFSMDVEDYYFPERDDNPYAVSRTRDEVRQLMQADITLHPGYVLSTVRPDWGEKINRTYRLAVRLRAAKELRMQRIAQREALRFGERVLPGGDMYEQQRAFHELVQKREESFVDKEIPLLTCPILSIDAARPLAEIIEEIAEKYARITKTPAEA